MLRNRKHRLPRRGMTLLELVLALALAGVLLTAIGMALHLHWRAFDVRRSRIEEAQLATAILRHISDDIRGTLKFEPPNLDGLNLSSLTANAAASALEGVMPEDSEGDPEGTPSPMENEDPDSPDPMSPTTPTPDGGEENPNSDSTGGSQTGGGNSTTAGGTTASDTTTEAAESGPSVVVGLYGSATQLQFDISRLPRVDQYQMQEAEDGSVQVPSDIKTVVYYLAEDIAAADGALAIPPSTTPSGTGTGRGLMRSESDRAVSAYGEMGGSTDSLFGGAKLLAAEVTSLQFQYFDGTEWLTEWNSDELKGLPTAIEVVLTISSADGTATAPVADPLLAPDAAAQPTYRIVVHLPVGGITESTETAETAEGTTDTAAPQEETMP